MTARYLLGGLSLGAATGLLLAACEVAYVLDTAAPSFDGPAEAVRFAAAVALVLIAAGALIGAAEGLTFAAVASLADALASARTRRAVWQARIFTALATPAVAQACAQMFRGPRART